MWHCSGLSIGGDQLSMTKGRFAYADVVCLQRGGGERENRGGEQTDRTRKKTVQPSLTSQKILGDDHCGVIGQLILLLSKELVSYNNDIQQHTTKSTFSNILVAFFGGLITQALFYTKEYIY